MIKRATYLIGLTLVLLTGCKSSAPTAVEAENAPAWTKAKPVDPFAYIGIGVAPIQADGSHLQRAKNAALADLSSEISVEVNASSMLYQLEQNRQFREEFRAQTELSTLETIDEYEMVDSYESGGYYWLQYRLDKATYARQRAAKKRTAVEHSMTYFRLAEEADRNGQIPTAIGHIMTALSEVKPYLNEPIPVEGMETDYGITLYEKLNNLVAEILVRPQVQSVDLLRYAPAGPAQIYFQTVNDRGATLSNIPVYLYYTGGFLRENQMRSDEFGSVRFPLPAASGSSDHERLEADVNLVALAEATTKDPLLRMLLTRHQGDRAQIEVNVRAPRVYITSRERIDGETLSDKPIEQALRRFLLNNKFSVTPVMAEADLMVNIESDAEALGTRDKMHLANMSGEVTVKNAEGRLLQSLPLSNYQGVQLSPELAERDAYRRAIREMEDHEFRRLFIR